MPILIGINNFETTADKIIMAIVMEIYFRMLTEIKIDILKMLLNFQILFNLLK